MRMKFASIHLYDPERKLTTEQFRRTYMNTLHDIEGECRERCRNLHALFGEAVSKEDEAKLRRMMEAELKKIEFAHLGAWHTAYDPNYTFETVEPAAQAFSNVVDTPVFFAAVFDGDILLFGVCLKGELVTRHILSGFFARREYGLMKQRADVRLLCEMLSLKDKSLVVQLCKQRRVDKAVKLLETLLGVPLCMSAGN